jgi:hypothetical protein
MKITEKAENARAIFKTRENIGKSALAGCGISAGKMRKMPQEACAISYFSGHIPKFVEENVSAKSPYFIWPLPDGRTFSAFSVNLGFTGARVPSQWVKCR